MANKPATLPPWIVARAGGRRRYNAARQRAAQRRMHEVYRLLMTTDLRQAAIARRLGVNRSTVCRDMQTIQYLLSRGKQGKRHTTARRLVLRYTSEF